MDECFEICYDTVVWLYDEVESRKEQIPMKDEIIIDIKEVYHRVLKKWKLLILAAVIGALVMSVVGYVNAYRNHEQKQPVDEATLEAYKSKLSEKDLEAAEQAFDTYEIYKKQYQSALEYSKNSILMKLGTDNVATVEMQYYIDNHYKSVYPVIEQKNNVTDIIEAYSLQLMSGDVIDKFKEATGTDIEGRYLRELINIAPIEDTQTMKITICTDSKELTDGIADVIEQEVNTYTQEMQQQYGEFDIVGANRCETAGIDDAVFELQQKEITLITTLKTQIDAVGNNLNEEQKVYYSALINNTEATKDNFQGQIINKKNIFIGCGMGIVLVLCYIILRYMLQKELRNPYDLRDVYHSYTVGVIKELEQEVEPIADQIKAFAVRGKITKIGLISTEVSAETKNILDILACKIKDDDLKISTACGIRQIPNVLKEFGEASQVILIEKKNKSTYGDIEREIELCDKCNVKILGNIIIDVE